MSETTNLRAAYTRALTSERTFAFTDLTPEPDQNGFRARIVRDGQQVGVVNHSGRDTFIMFALEPEVFTDFETEAETFFADAATISDTGVRLANDPMAYRYINASMPSPRPSQNPAVLFYIDALAKAAHMSLRDDYEVLTDGGCVPGWNQGTRYRIGRSVASAKAAAEFGMDPSAPDETLMVKAASLFALSQVGEPHRYMMFDDPHVWLRDENRFVPAQDLAR